MMAAAAPAPAPSPTVWTPSQRHYMERIVEGMQKGNIALVAEALNGAVAAMVSIPDVFLTTVQQWMNSRQQSAAASTQITSMAQAAPQPAAAAAPAAIPESTFHDLKKRLEDAIRRKDTHLVPLILKQAAELAEKGGSPHLPFGAQPPGGDSPAAFAGAATPLIAPQAAGAFTPALGLQGGVTPPVPWAAMQPKLQEVKQYAETPLLHGAATPIVPGLKTVKQGEEATLLTQGAAKLAPDDSKLPHSAQTSLQAAMPKAPPSGVPPPAQPDYSPLGHLEDDLPAFDDAPQPPLAKSRLRSKKSDPDAVASFPEDEYGLGGGISSSVRKSTPTASQMASALGTTQGDSATFKKLCSLFDPPALKEHLRRTAEGRPDLFAVLEDQVSLRDPTRQDALKSLVRHLIRKPLMRKVIRAAEADEVIRAAAECALHAVPLDVAKVLVKVSTKTLKKTAKVTKGSHPANMPVVLACLIDHIVTLERRQRVSRKFETVFGPLLYQIVFSKWTLGVVPGSNFLANILLSWEHRGFFKPKQLDRCKKPLMLLIAYARSDGVPDGEDKENGTGWYKIVKGPEAPPPEPTATEDAFTQPVESGHDSAPTPVVPDEATDAAPAEAPPQPVSTATAADSLPAALVDAPAEAVSDASGPQPDPTIDTPVATAQQTVEDPADVPSPVPEREEDEEDAPTEDLFGSPLPDEEEEDQAMPDADQTQAAPAADLQDQAMVVDHSEAAAPAAHSQAAAPAAHSQAAPAADSQATQPHPDPQLLLATQPYPEEGLGGPPEKKQRTDDAAGALP